MLSVDQSDAIDAGQNRLSGGVVADVSFAGVSTSTWSRCRGARS